MNRLLVIGGTGNVGRQVVDQLAATGARFRAMTRNPDAAGLPPQVEVVRGDLTVPETLDRCLQVRRQRPAFLGAADSRRRRRALAAPQRAYGPDG
jgi:nucleoside-diphosphate-sugar epimerase